MILPPQMFSIFMSLDTDAVADGEAGGFILRGR